MYCERREDCHNLEVSGMMMKAEFLDFKRSLHLADNNALNSQINLRKGDYYLMLLPLIVWLPLIYKILGNMCILFNSPA